MSTSTVTKVRREWASDNSHRHIEGVCTSDGTHYTRQAVVNSINAGNVWKTSADGYTATITTTQSCPHGTCPATPYIKTNPNSTEKDNLENLPEC